LWDSTASTKEDIVGILVESPKITKEKIVTEREISRKILTVKEISIVQKVRHKCFDSRAN
jgi:hypothetical protein